MPSRTRSVPEQLELAWPAAGRVAGVDEAGRGPLAGPVVAAAVILDEARPMKGLADSKLLSAPRRVQLDALIRERALAWAIGEASVQEIDALNILQATLLAMRRAVLALQPAPDLVLVDGNRLPDLPLPAQAIVRGDARVAAISAASVLAKVHRDSLCQALDRSWPAYGFAVHKGYPTASHLAALALHGACPAHRRSFGPVRAAGDHGGEG
ncbi:MAG: ribonuclease HII [Rubrivivax sp.]